MTRRTATHPQLTSPPQPPTRERPASGFTVLPLDDRRCPRREVAMLCETDSGHRWDGA
ncbi:hypothetical protein FBZ84_101355 [Azospirillum baldaniorum]|uniref:hypothetical protein n=1 Tax=Azospirillum baldaniorum TaxID=1064539 RepID=UPI0011ABCEC0|nr:hypothetical protein [Azospirillum baldaniorum]TWA72081.1 hypothetical protein FBZ84_101355 [Azospirillum baldaniorum]